MINFFPEPYEDELIYSLLSRFYMKSGYVSYAKVSEILFTNKAVRPDVEFVSRLNNEITDVIYKRVSREDAALRMTMYPYYARFLSRNRQLQAFSSLLEMKGNYNNLLSMPRLTVRRYLKYCPLCAKEDRENKGEAYWRRAHQIQGIIICPKHSCKLIESKVPLTKDERVTLKPCEMEAEEQEPIFGNPLESDYSRYLSKILTEEFTFNGDTSIGEYLKEKIGHTSNPKLLKNMQEFYKGTDILSITEDFQILKILQGVRFNPSEICQIAYFLNIDIEGLLNFSKEKVSKEAVNKPKKVIIKEKPDYEALDKETLPLIREAINRLQDGEQKPRRITYSSVIKELGLSKARINLLPESKSEVSKHYEDIDSYHARIIIWAIRKIQRESGILSWNQIFLLTNIMKPYRESCINKLKEIDDKGIQSLLCTVK